MSDITTRAFQRSQQPMLLLDGQGVVFEHNDAAAAMCSPNSNLKGVPLCQIFAQASELNQQALNNAIKKASEGQVSEINIFAETEYELRLTPIIEAGQDIVVLCEAQQISNRLKIKQMMNTIVAGVSGQTGDGFFQNLVVQLSKVLDTRYAFVGGVDPNECTAVTTLAVAADGKIVDNMSYSLEATPCSEVLDRSTCVYPNRICQLFPDDKLLVQMQAESYVGTRLVDSHGRTIGLIVVIDDKPMGDTQLAREILEIFAASTTAELERKFAEKELLSTRRKLEMHMQNTPLAVIEWDTKARVVFWNAAAQNVFGYTAAEAMGRSFEEMIVPEQARKHVSAVWNELLTQQGGSHSINDNVNKAGQLIRCEWFNTPLINDENEVVGVASLVADVTVEQENYRLLKQREQEQSEILNNMIDAVITIDQTGRVLTFNDAAVTMFGYLPQQVLGKNVSLLMPTDVAEHHDSYITRYLDSGEGSIIGAGREVVAKRCDGSFFPVRLSISELSSREAGLKRFIGTCHDLTHEKKQTEQIRRTQKMDALGKLTGGIAHDFNNLLGVIIGYADLLRTMMDDSPSLSRYVDEIHHAGLRGTELTQKLLSFSRQQSANPVRCQINNKMKEMRLMLEKTLTPSVTVIYKLDDALAPVVVDEGDLEDAIVNLCINAGHAMESKGELTLETANRTVTAFDEVSVGVPAGEYSVLSISDTGCGMNNYTIDKIFDPFFTTKGEQGTGLGLSQVYGFVERSHGRLRVYSEVGHGTRFSIYLPQDFSEENRPSQAPKDTQQSLNGKENLLLVDDEKALLEFVSEVFASHGYQVFSAENAEQALNILASNKIDAMLSDVIMPGMSGYELAAKVKQDYPKVKIQLASGFTDDRYNSYFDEQLRRKLIAKPYTSKTVLRAMRSLLDESAS